MYPPEREQYESFLNDGLGCAHYYRLYQGNRLVAVTVADEMLDGLAAIYTFFDPDQPQRSLGTEAILLQIQGGQSKRTALCLPRLLDRRLSQDVL